MANSDELVEQGVKQGTERRSVPATNISAYSNGVFRWQAPTLPNLNQLKARAKAVAAQALQDTPCGAATQESLGLTGDTRKAGQLSG